MALTVDSAPDGFRPIGNGSLIYAFTEASVVGKTNYRVEIEFNGLNLPIFSFRPEPGTVNVSIECDLATALRSLLEMDLFSSTLLLNTYVKYQAVWDTGSDAQVPLSSDVIYFYSGVQNPRYEPQDETHLTILSPTAKIYAWPDNGSFAVSNRTSIIDKGTFGANFYAVYFPSILGGVGINLQTFDGITPGIKYFDVSGTNLFNSSGQIKFQDSQYPTPPGTVLATIQVIKMDSCKNPIDVSWLNDLGGSSHWVFDGDQILSIDPSSDGQFEIKTVVHRFLTIEQWFLLNQLNKIGAEYGENQKIGADVWDITDKTNPPSTYFQIFVIPQIESTRTKKAKNEFQIDLRYPLLDNIGI